MRRAARARSLPRPLEAAARRGRDEAGRGARGRESVFFFPFLFFFWGARARARARPERDGERRRARPRPRRRSRAAWSARHPLRPSQTFSPRRLRPAPPHPRASAAGPPRSHPPPTLPRPDFFLSNFFFFPRARCARRPAALAEHPLPPCPEALPAAHAAHVGAHGTQPRINSRLAGANSERAKLLTNALARLWLGGRYEGGRNLGRLPHRGAGPYRRRSMDRSRHLSGCPAGKASGLSLVNELFNHGKHSRVWRKASVYRRPIGNRRCDETEIVQLSARCAAGGGGGGWGGARSGDDELAERGACGRAPRACGGCGRLSQAPARGRPQSAAPHTPMSDAAWQLRTLSRLLSADAGAIDQYGLGSVGISSSSRSLLFRTSMPAYMSASHAHFGASPLGYMTSM